MGRDGLTGLVVCAASLVLFWLTLELKDNPLVPIGPGFYPRVVLAITAALGAWLVLSDFLRSRRRPPAGAKPAAATPSAAQPNYIAVAIQFVLFGLYVAALPSLGFRISTFIYVGAVNAVLDPPQRPKQWWRVIALALAAAFATWFVFERYLSVLMPRGRWTGL
ncbi:MAG: tripartite tricarboxylate transporter TctB family protein [Burkholderiales bacterium]